MRKRRADSPWSKLTQEQVIQLDKWLYTENLPYEAILAKIEAEFGIKTTRQTLAAYRAERLEVRESLLQDFLHRIEAEERIAEALESRLGAGTPLDELKERAIYCTAMAAYELALAKPEKLRVKELRSLMKILNDDRRLISHLERTKLRSEAFEMMSLLKIRKELANFSTAEQEKQSITTTAELAKFLLKKRIEVDEEIKKWTQEKLKAAQERNRAPESSAKSRDPEPSGGPTERREGTGKCEPENPFSKETDAAPEAPKM